MQYPSGEQLTIHWEDQEATVVAVGAGLRQYEADGGTVLDGYRIDEMCTAARGQPLIPWPNRLKDGRYSFQGEEYQLPLTEPAKFNAIHGLVRWSVWSPRLVEPSRVTMGHTLFPRPGYPFLLDLEIDYELSDQGLRVELTVRNQGGRPAPVGAGQHPYLLPSGSLEKAVLELPAASRLVTDARQIPTGTAAVEGTEFDFRSGRRIGDTKLDTAFCGLSREPDRRFWLRLSGEERSIRVWLDEQFKYVMAFTGDSLPDPATRRRSLGVEPMSCPPNALQTGQDVVVLHPGEVWMAAWGIESRRA